MFVGKKLIFAFAEDAVIFLTKPKLAYPLLFLRHERLIDAWAVWRGYLFSVPVRSAIRPSLIEFAPPSVWS
jgi:hypothetical protein